MIEAPVPGQRSPNGGDAAAVLAGLEQNVVTRRRAEVEELELLLTWAELHSVDPATQPGATPASKGGPVLVQVGGQGTPEVVDLCIGEVAIARHAGWAATQNMLADALDLTYRLPRLWGATQGLECQAWVARKIARMTRPLTPAGCALVDQAVTEALAQGPGRLLAIAEAKIIEADPHAHQQRLQDAARRRGVWFTSPRPGDIVDPDAGTAGVATMIARLKTGQTLELAEAIDQIADLLAVHSTDNDTGDAPTIGQLRADALALLADPAAALRFLQSSQDGPNSITEQPEGAEPDRHQGQSTGDDDRTSRAASTSCARGRVVLHLHVTDQVLLDPATGVIRCEELGPLLVDQLPQVLRGRHITVQPVIDLHHGRSVNSYEHPTDVKTRARLRTVGDVFPHSTSKPGARVDIDHPTPYDPHGPPTQTGDHNAAPLTRRHHRARTHLGYRLEQTGPNTYRWTTPHGLTRHVTGAGTLTG